MYNNGYGGHQHGPPPSWHDPAGHQRAAPSASASAQTSMYNARPPPQGQMMHGGPHPNMYNGPSPSYALPAGVPTGPSAMTGVDPMGFNGRPPPQGPSPSIAAHASGETPVHTTIFIGTISAGVTDEWIHRLLSACGQLRSFKRVNASFGFAEFVDPESVLRTLAVLSSRELPVMGKEALEGSGTPKKLTVKADEKTRKYLDQYEQGRSTTNDHASDAAHASQAVDGLVMQMAEAANVSAAAESTNSYNVPSHLKDLPPEDVPEEHRGTVLSEIDKFRQASAARDEERRRREKAREFERSRNAGHPSRRGADSSEYAYREGDRADRQSYQRPIDFVAGQKAQEEKQLPADERDERAEERRRQRDLEDRERATYENERRYLDSERARLSYWKREYERENADVQKRKDLGEAMRRVFERWDQAREMERDMFYYDRAHWRSARRPVREREEREDEEDQRAQKEEEERARQEAEQFLAQQAADMAAFEREQRAAGVLMPTSDGVHAPLKLKRVAAAMPEGENSAAQVSVVPSGGVLGNAEDDDADVVNKRKGRLAHIDLTDEETKKERFRTSLPGQIGELFAMLPAWDKLDPTLVDSKYKGLLDEAITESLGESVPDMVEELVDKLRKRGKAQELVDVVEPVLEDESAQLIQKVWIELLVDTLAV